MEVKDAIQIFRKHSKLSQEDVAEYLNIARATYTQIELGQRKLTLDEALLLCTKYGVTVGALLNGDLNSISTFTKTMDRCKFDIGNTVEYENRLGKDEGKITAILVRQGYIQYGVSWSDKRESWHCDFELRLKSN